MRRWSVLLSSVALGALMTAGAAWYIPSQMHVVRRPRPRRRGRAQGTHLVP